MRKVIGQNAIRYYNTKKLKCSVLACLLSKRTFVVSLPADITGMKKGHKGPIPVAEAGDLPPSTRVVTVFVTKKHWGKATLAARALGVGAVALQTRRTLPIISNQTWKQ
eukprot:NODE_8_length_47770_cov_0.334354.p24 type:complete len:109 gc:universal NODE_8_length_47770_cov_0.334354:11614-11940(+)